MPPITRTMADTVLVVVDVQNDFLPGGALAVPHGDAVIAPINRLAAHYDHIVLTQDWHPPGHISFASTHPAYADAGTVRLPDGRYQMLWPDHCLQGSYGAALAEGLEVAKAQLIIRKGYRRGLDSYSAFVEADGQTQTGLAGYCRERGLTSVVVTGLAFDFCVAQTACDAKKAGFTTSVVVDATRGIGIDGSAENARTRMEKLGVYQTSVASLIG